MIHDLLCGVLGIRRTVLYNKFTVLYRILDCFVRGNGATTTLRQSFKMSLQHQETMARRV